MLNIKQKAKTFFESLPSYNDGYLDVGDGHSIYYEEYGNPNGKPILFLHGGPGAGFSNSHKGFFDPKIFRVVFLGSKSEVNWFLYDIKKFFPEAHNKFISYVPETERKNILSWFHTQLNIKDSSINLKAASVWAEYENSCSTLEYAERPMSGENALAISRIETHYFVNDCFISKDFIIKNIHKINHIPAIIVQGRHDVICPPFSAMNLSKKWQASEIQIVENAGHSAFESDISRKIINALHMIK